MKKVTVECPACGKPVFFLAEIDWMPPESDLERIIPFAYIMQQAAAFSPLVNRKKTLACLNVMCCRRFSILIPQPGSQRAD
ncbi:MAG: hypothetical protein V3T61_07595 [Acidobacteriota bacterium]